MSLINETYLRNYFFLTTSPNIAVNNVFVDVWQHCPSHYIYMNLKISIIDKVPFETLFPNVYVSYEMYVPAIPTLISSSIHARYELKSHTYPCFENFASVIHFNAFTGEQYPGRAYRIFDNAEECCQYCNQLNERYFRGKNVSKKFKENIADYFSRPLFLIKKFKLWCK